MAASLHQLMGIIETAIWSQWNIALGREHDFYLYASFYCILQCLFEFMAQGEVGADNLDAVLCIIDGIHIEISDDILCNMRFAVDDAHCLMIGCSSGVGLEILYQIIFFLLAVILFAVNMLTANLFHILRNIFCRVFTSLPSMRQCMSCHSPTTSVPLI